MFKNLRRKFRNGEIQQTKIGNPDYKGKYLFDITKPTMFCLIKGIVKIGKKRRLKNICNVHSR